VLPRVVVLAIATLALPPPVSAELKPLWEAGIGPVGLYLPDYRGSNQSRGYVYPFPYVVYRGDFFKIDRWGIRTLFIDTDRVALDISGYGTPPVDSSKNTARQGMPDLNPTVEVGPALNITLARDKRIDYTYRFDLRLPVRAAIATDLKSWQGIGFTFYPNLSLDLRPELFGRRWNAAIQAGVLYTSRKYNEYFYSVPLQFATPTRPPYAAPGGYSGAVFIASFSRRFDKMWVGGYIRYDNLSGAVFDPSPLVLRNSAIGGGIAIAWVFAESDRRVEADD